MPLHRRLPKRGFTNIFKKEYAVVNLIDLDRFEDGDTVDRLSLIAKGLVARKYTLVKILGTGEVSIKLKVAVDKISVAAKAKIEAAGGTIEG
jgi:large subunit ribosomal protein L15